MRARSLVFAGLAILSAASPAFAETPAPAGSMADLLHALQDSFARLDRQRTLREWSETNNLVTRFLTESHKYLSGLKDRLDAQLMNRVQRQVASKGYQFVMLSNFDNQGVDLFAHKTKVGILGRYLRTETDGDYLDHAGLTPITYAAPPLPLVVDHAAADFRKLVATIPKTPLTTLTTPLGTDVVVLGTVVRCGTRRLPTVLPGLCLDVDDGWRISGG
jgi:hypothetical protein